MGLKRLVMTMVPPPVAGRLRAWRVRQLIRRYTARAVRHVYGSGPLWVWLADPLAEGWYDRDWPELPEIAELRGGGLRPGARVFDVGAHQGVVAMMLAREVAPDGLVVAVEPSAHNAAVARRNRELNRLGNLEIVESAVTDRSGSVVLTRGLNGQLDDGTGTGGRTTVASTTIDELAARFGVPDVLFLDVEGAECSALAGASTVLARFPDVFVEVHVGHGLETLGGSVEEVFSYFAAERYTLLGRAENDEHFRPLTGSADPLTRDRFFLLARAG